MILQPNEILITVKSDSVKVDSSVKGEEVRNPEMLMSYIERLIKLKQKQIEDKVQYVPEFEIDSIVTLKANPGATLFKVRKNFGIHSEVEKINRTDLEKISDMTFYVNRLSLVQYKEKKKCNHYHMHYDDFENCKKCEEEKK